MMSVSVNFPSQLRQKLVPLKMTSKSQNFAHMFHFLSPSLRRSQKSEVFPSHILFCNVGGKVLASKSNELFTCFNGSSRYSLTCGCCSLLTEVLTESIGLYIVGKSVFSLEKDSLWLFIPSVC